MKFSGGCLAVINKGEKFEVQGENIVKEERFLIKKEKFGVNKTKNMKVELESKTNIVCQSNFDSRKVAIYLQTDKE